MSLWQRLINLVVPQAEREHLKLLGRQSLAHQLQLQPTTQTHPDDIFIVGYPKSGNTWFQNITCGLQYGVDLKRTPFTVVNRLVPDIYDEYYQRHQTPTVFKSHRLPNVDYKRVVYLVRDGRDVMVSYYHYLKNLGYRGSLAQFVVDNPSPFGTWSNHVEAWLQNPHDAHMLIIRYEDMLTNAHTELRRFCDFTGLVADDATLNTIIEMTSFKQMQAKEQQYGIHIKDWDGGQPFVRRGKSGSYRDEMPTDVQAQFLKSNRRTLEKFNYL